MKSEVLCGGKCMLSFRQLQQSSFGPCFAVQMDFGNNRFEKIPLGFKVGFHGLFKVQLTLKTTFYMWINCIKEGLIVMSTCPVIVNDFFS